MNAVALQAIPNTVHKPLNPQPVPYVSGIARAEDELSKRRRLQKEIDWQLRTPLEGCERLPEKERREIWATIKGARFVCGGWE